MNQTAINYAAALYGLSIPEEAIRESAELLAQVPQLAQVLKSPVTSLAEKHAVISRTFPKAMQNFLKELCDNQDTGCLDQVFEAYENYSLQMKGILKAELRCAADPTEEDLLRITDHVRRQYKTSEIRWNVVHDPSLIGGFVIRIGDRESDWSIRGRLAQLQQKLIWR